MGCFVIIQNTATPPLHIDMLIKRATLFCVILSLGSLLSAQEFKNQQMKYGRVRNAYHEKGKEVYSVLKAKQLDTSSLEIMIRVLKLDHKLEIWGRDSLHSEFLLINEYRICRSSGKPGPKRRQGDYQVPEGFYHIDRFNAWSNFHLSLGINYPNTSDKILSDKRNPGGDIFIHGACVTIGCMPMTDDKIKEIYIFAVEARNAGQQKIPVQIFPTRMEGEAYENLINQYGEDGELIVFWRNLEEGYLYFETNKELPRYTVNNHGLYCFE